MQFTTPVHLDPSSFLLTPASRVLLIGSCFAEEVGRHMEGTLPQGNALINPFGVLYNARSIAQLLRCLMQDELPDDGLLFQGGDGLWRSWLYSGAFVAETREQCRTLVENQLHAGAKMLAQADVLFLTFSTTHCYRLAERPDVVVSNCHKALAGTFIEDNDSLTDLLALWQATWQLLRTHRPDLKVVFTLSPYRYRKYGLHTSQVDKAKLLLLIDELTAADAHGHYFPAYEFLMDELRDYRFYKPDMLHPTAQTVDYIWERFRDWCFSPDLCDFEAERNTLRREAAHRPLHPNSAAHHEFEQKHRARLQLFRQKWGTPAI